MGSDFVDGTSRKARKAHICNWCDGKIEKGTVYYHLVGKDGGEFFTDRRCAECDKLIDEYCEKYHLYSFSEDEIQEWWQEDKCPACKNYSNCDYSFSGIRCKNFEEEINAQETGLPILEADKR